MHIWLVSNSDQDGNDRDWFVAATTAEEAFELWRIELGIDPDTDEIDPDDTAWVFMMPDVPSTPQVMVWPAGISYGFDYQSLATRAVRAAYREQTNADNS